MKYLILMTTVLLLYGCATKLPETGYQELSQVYGATAKCYQEGMIDPAFFVQAQNAFKYTLNSWSTDDDKFDRMSQQAFHETKANQNLCRQARTRVHQLVSSIEKDKADKVQTEAAIAEINQSLDTFNQSMNGYLQGDQPNTQQGTWGLQPQQETRQIHCYRTADSQLLCRE